MSKKTCCVSVAETHDPHKTARHIKDINPDNIEIAAVGITLGNNRTSALVFIKCPEESFEQIRNLPGVIELEPQPPDDEAVTRFEGGIPNI